MYSNSFSYWAQCKVTTEHSNSQLSQVVVCKLKTQLHPNCHLCFAPKYSQWEKISKGNLCIYERHWHASQRHITSEYSNSGENTQLIYLRWRKRSGVFIGRERHFTELADPLDCWNMGVVQWRRENCKIWFLTFLIYITWIWISITCLISRHVNAFIVGKV